MSNLDNLVQKILDDAKYQADMIMEESKKVNEEIINAKVKEANERKAKILERAATEASLLKERVISNAELQVRNEKLKAKQEVVERVFSLAKERLKNIDEEKYISYLKNTLKGLNLKGTETLIVPEKMKAKVKALELGLKVSDKETIDSGFLLKDEGVLLNHTFDALVDFLREELEVDVAMSLFKELE
ncbi:MAG TPA: V-type ATP synthase subunit E [Clostridia bacterium]|nr:V-type ATP synthase subunit E [Clostridia bacterium]